MGTVIRAPEILKHSWIVRKIAADLNHAPIHCSPVPHYLHSFPPSFTRTDIRRVSFVTLMRWFWTKGGAGCQARDWRVRTSHTLVSRVSQGLRSLEYLVEAACVFLDGAALGGIL